MLISFMFVVFVFFSIVMLVFRGVVFFKRTLPTKKQIANSYLVEGRKLLVGGYKLRVTEHFRYLNWRNPHLNIYIYKLY